MSDDCKIRKATIADIKHCHAQINLFAKQDLMLPRSLSELYENVRDFFVCEDDGKFIGCCALHIMWEDLAEVKSLAVAESHHGQGIGHRLVTVCVDEARLLGMPRVFVLTYQRIFFERQGFKVVSKDTLNRKVWAECVRCPHFPDCDEIAMDILL